jgi:hypothetical protein
LSATPDRRAGRPRGLLVGVFLFALLVRVAYLAGVLGVDSPVPHRYDDGIYDDLGRAIAAGHGMSFQGRPTAIVSPGYPYYIGGCYALTGPSPAGPRLVQAVLGAFTAALLAAIALELGLGMGAAALAGGAAALHPASVYFVGRYFPMVLHLALLGAALHALLRWRRGSWGWLVAGGLALGSAALVRADALLLAPALALALAWMAGGTRRAWTGAAALLALVVALQLPWLLRNQRLLGAPVLTTTFAWRTLWVGNNPWARGGYVLSDEVLERHSGLSGEAALRPVERDQLAALRRWDRLQASMSEVQQESVFRALVVDWRRREPARYLLNTARKLWAFASPVPGQGGAVLQRFGGVIALTYGLLLPLTVLGLAAAWPLGRERWLFFAVLAQALLTAVLVFGHPRFRFAVEMLFLPYAGFGLMRLRAWLESRRRPAGPSGNRPAFPERRGPGV